MSFADRDGLIWFDGETGALARGDRCTCSRTPCTTASACSRACGPTRTPDRGTCIFKLAEHTERLFNSAKILGMHMPYSRGYAARGTAHGGARERARRGLPEAHVLLRLRGHGSARGQPEDARRSSPPGNGPRTWTRTPRAAVSRCAHRPSRGTTSTSPCARPRPTATTSTRCWPCARPSRAAPRRRCCSTTRATWQRAAARTFSSCAAGSCTRRS
jgi:hypothetical protein